MLRQISQTIEVNRQTLFYLLICLIAIVLPFAPVLFDSETVLVYRDLVQALVPEKYVWLQSVKNEFSLPQWNPYLLSGTPYLADLKRAALSPFNLVLLFFSTEQIYHAVGWLIFAHFPLIFLAMFSLLRHLQFSLPPATALAFAYAMSGLSFSAISMPAFLSVQLCLPLFCLFSARLRALDCHLLSWPAFGLLIVVILPLLSASPFFSYLLCLAAIPVFLVPFHPTRLARLSAFGLLVILGLTPALLPGLEQLLASSRTEFDTAALHTSIGSFHPVRLLEFFLALPFGNFVPENDFWGTRFTDSPIGTPLFFSYYTGPGLLPGLAGVYLFWQKRYWLVTLPFAFFLLLGMGGFAPVDFFGIARNHLPLFQLFRIPEKSMLVSHFILMLAQTMGFYHLWVNKQALKPALAITAAGCALISISYLAVCHQFDQPLLQPALLHFILLQLALALCLVYRHYQQARPALSTFFLLAIFLTDLGIQGRALLWPQPLVVTQSRIADTVRQNIKTRQAEIHTGEAFRFTSMFARPDLFMRHEVADGRLDTIGLNTLSVTARALPNSSVVLGLHDISGRSLLSDRTYDHFRENLLHNAPMQLLNLTGARYILNLPDKSNQEIHVRINELAQPYFSTPEKVGQVDNLEQALPVLMTLNTLRSALLIREVSGASPAATSPAAETPVFTFTANQKYSLQMTEKKLAAISLRAKIIAKPIPAGTSEENQTIDSGDTRDPQGWLVLNERYHSYWRATINGTEVPVEKANGFSMAVNLSASSLRGACAQQCLVQFRYHNPLVLPGLLAGLLLVFCYAGAIYWRGRRCSINARN